MTRTPLLSRKRIMFLLTSFVELVQIPRWWPNLPFPWASSSQGKNGPCWEPQLRKEQLYIWKRAFQTFMGSARCEKPMHKLPKQSLYQTSSSLDFLLPHLLKHTARWTWGFKAQQAYILLLIYLRHCDIVLHQNKLRGSVHRCHGHLLPKSPWLRGVSSSSFPI